MRRATHRFHAACLLGVSLAAGAGTLPVGPAAGDLPLSPFYRADGQLPARAGVLLRAEPLEIQQELSAAGQGWRMLHTSEDARWQSGQVPVSGLLLLPRGERPAGGWPVLAWAHGTLGISDRCAPSWTGLRERDATYINRWLAAGHAVVLTDYQGLGGPGPHPYLNWRVEGRSVLDAVRAALQLRPDDLANRVMLAGQSQGSGAALGAARLAKAYAPDLVVRGVIATGLNSSFPDGPVSLPERNSSNMFLSYAAGGLRDDGPAIDDIVNDKGRQLLEAARSGCTADVVKLARRLRVASLADAFAIPMEKLAELRLPVTDMPVARIGMPVFVGTGLADATILPERQYAAVSALCAGGDGVTWQRYAGHGHDGTLHGSFEDSLAFATRALQGRSQPSACQRLERPGPPEARRADLPFNDD